MKRVSFLKKAQKGFTLIELIITIVIIGILAAVAVPKFLSLSDDAKQSVVDGVAGALASASSVNYAKSQSPTTTGAVIPVDCDDATADALLTGGRPAGISISGTAPTGPGAVATCTVTSGTGSTAKTATFTLIGT